MNETTDRTLAAYARATTGIELLPRSEDAPGIQDAALGEIRFAGTLPLPWTRTIGDTYGLLRMARHHQKDTA